MTKLINGKSEKDVTNDMRRVVSGKTDWLNMIHMINTWMFAFSSHLLRETAGSRNQFHC